MVYTCTRLLPNREAVLNGTTNSYTTMGPVGMVCRRPKCPGALERFGGIPSPGIPIPYIDEPSLYMWSNSSSGYLTLIVSIASDFPGIGMSVVSSKLFPPKTGRGEDFSAVRDDNTPVTPVREKAAFLKLKNTEAAADKIKSTDILDLMNEMRDFRREMKEINIDFKNNMEKYSEWIIDNGNKIEEVGKQVRGIKEDISHLYQENINLRKTVQELTNKTNFLEQASKENDKEDLLDLISRVAAAIGFEFQVNMIDNCYRYRTAAGADGRPGGIVVRFVRKLDLEHFIQKRKDKRNLYTRDIGFMEGQSNPIYVNNSLTQANRKLLNKAREVKREKQYTYL
ncbi:hypothetical protein J6590_076138 [Homalodisca vitripennis]|nr:hypothetical protein J6590_076138 [Homalodisca vitripennis]